MSAPLSINNLAISTALLSHAKWRGVNYFKMIRMNKHHERQRREREITNEQTPWETKKRKRNIKWTNFMRDKEDKVKI